VISSIGGVARALEKRILTDCMDLLILSIMYNGHNIIGGYDVIRYLHRRFHFLLSPGTVYPQLYALERKGLIEAAGNGGKRTYALTEKGRKYFQMILNDVIFKNGFKPSQ